MAPPRPTPPLWALVVLLVLGAVDVTEGLPANYDTVEDQSRYLHQFGYVADQSMGAVVAALQGGLPSSAVRDFQQMAQIPQTGVVDAQTKQMMALARCGNKDVVPGGSGRRRRRYVIHDMTLSRRDLTWQIVTFSSRMDRRTQTDEVAAAFKLWEDNSGLTFTHTPDAASADFRIRFVTRSHGDSQPFDGEGGVLAHAYFPGTVVDTNVHFDEDEIWSKDSPEGRNMRWVATHELGHSLGLRHSMVKEALMYPFYKKWRNNYNFLGTDDVSAIQSVYGGPGSSNPGGGGPGGGGTGGPSGSTLQPQPPNEGSNSFCADPFFHAVFTRQPYTYIFHNEYVMKYTNNFETEGEWPRRTQTVFSNNGQTVTGAIEAEGRIYVVQGSGVYVYDGGLIFRGYFSLNSMFPGFYSIDTIFQYDNKWFIIKDVFSYEVVPAERQSGVVVVWAVRDGRAVTATWGPPQGCSRITAATQWLNGKLYFFCGSVYYRFNPNTNSFDRSAYPNYPRLNSQYWLSCEYGRQVGEVGDGGPRVVGVREPYDPPDDPRLAPSASSTPPPPRAHLYTWGSLGALHLVLRIVISDRN